MSEPTPSRSASLRARENARRRAEKAKALDSARGRLAAIAEALDVNARQARAMTELFAVDTLAEVAVKLEDCRRRDEARAEIAKEIRAIVGAGVAASLEAARAVLEGADAAALAAELAALKIRAPHDDQAHAEAHSALARRSSGWRRSAATTRSRASRKSGAPSSRKSRTARGAIWRCARAWRRRTRRCVSIATGIAAR